MLVTVRLDEKLKFDCDVVFRSHHAVCKILFGYEDGLDMSLDRWDEINLGTREKIKGEAIAIAKDLRDRRLDA